MKLQMCKIAGLFTFYDILPGNRVGLLHSKAPALLSCWRLGRFLWEKTGCYFCNAEASTGLLNEGIVMPLTKLCNNNNKGKGWRKQLSVVYPPLGYRFLLMVV